MSLQETVAYVSFNLVQGGAFILSSVHKVLERVYMGNRFRNCTERLEKLFILYAKMINKVAV